MSDLYDNASATPPAVRALVSIMVGDGDRVAVLGRACEATKALIPGADEVSVTLLEDAAHTVASTGQLASRADELQYKFGQGPCLDAAQTGRPVLVDDVGADDRWPAYAHAVRGVGVGASLSVPLKGGDSAPAGALNIYARRPATFAATVVDVAVDLARYAAIVASVSSERARAVALAEQMEQAMQSRAVIEQAKGIIMRDRGCSAEDAFDVLVHLSQTSHRKLRDVAAQLVEQVSDLTFRSASNNE